MNVLTTNRKKILLLLAGGVALSLSREPGQYFKILGKIRKEWESVGRQKLRDDIRNLYRSKLVGIKSNTDGSFSLILTKKGKNKVLRYNLDSMRIKRQRWDGKWRIVLFDIPERQKPARDALRDKLKKLGFWELQKSIFVYPFDCENEIEFLVEFFHIKPHVRYGILESIDNELHIKKHFTALLGRRR
jgi:hypothetical protein